MLNEKIAWYLQSSNPIQLFEKILSRMEKVLLITHTYLLFQDYSLDLVKDSLCLIFSSRRGLSEKELLSLTGANRITFSVFYMAIREYLTNRTGLLSFFHDYMRSAVEARYLREPNAQL